jgi:hypothetical protein
MQPTTTPTLRDLAPDAPAPEVIRGGWCAVDTNFGMTQRR